MSLVGLLSQTLKEERMSGYDEDKPDLSLVNSVTAEAHSCSSVPPNLTTSPQVPDWPFCSSSELKYSPGF